MRVLVAPDSFGGTLTAVEAADAIAAGFRRADPSVELRRAPMTDGGPGFVDVLASATGGERRTLIVRGPLGDPVTAHVLVAASTAYVEAAQACGLHLVAAERRDPGRATSYGVGELIATARGGVQRVVVGLGGTATNDGGAGVWAALGAQPEARLAAGGLALAELGEVLPPHPVGVSLVVATDVDNPLLGPNGASAVYGPQKGADRETVLDLDDALRRWADVVEAGIARPGLRNLPGAGAGGGLGFGLMALGAVTTSGFDLVADMVGLRALVDGVDLVVTGEGRLDAQSLRGKVVVGVARLAQAAGVPCVAVAGQAAVGRRDAAAAGVDDIEAVADLLGSADAARESGAAGVERAAAAMAHRWARE